MFTLKPTLEENSFMIVKENTVKGEYFNRLPIKVYGFIRVEVYEKDRVGTSFKYIAQDIFDSGEILDLIDKARKLAISNMKNS